MQSFFPVQSGAPQMSSYIVTSPQQRRAAGVSSNYAEDYNNAQMQAFNNDYNYFLWQQQAQYNSPVEQVKRLREAGLNPNFNAIEGAGNLKDTPSSRGDLHSSATRNSMAQMQLALSVYNSIIDSVKKGIETTSQIAAIPADIRTYRHMINQSIGDTTYGKQLDNWLKQMQGAYQAKTTLGIDIPGVYLPNGLGTDPNHMKTAAYGSTHSAHPALVGKSYTNPDDTNYKAIDFGDAPRFKSIELENRYKSLMNDATALLDDLRQGQIDINSQTYKNLQENYRILNSDANFRNWMNGTSIGARVIGTFFNPIKIHF